MTAAPEAAPGVEDLEAALRPAWVDVDLEALESNVALMKVRMGEGTRTMAVVKADGYGHGAVGVSRALEALLEDQALVLHECEEDVSGADPHLAPDLGRDDQPALRAYGDGCGACQFVHGSPIVPHPGNAWHLCWSVARRSRPACRRRS